MFEKPRSVGLRAIPFLVVMAALIIAWQVGFSDARYFPSLATVGEVARDGLFESGDLWPHFGASLRRVAIGFTLGTILGVSVGWIMGVSKYARYPLHLYVGFLRFIPATAMIVLATLWFGTGEASKLFIIVFATVFMVALNTEAGVARVVANRVRGARSLGASSAQVIRTVVIPSTVPFIFAGMRIAMTNAIATIVAAELIAADEGLGYLIIRARAFLRTDEMFVAIFGLGLLGLGLDRLIGAIGRRLESRYGLSQ